MSALGFHVTPPQLTWHNTVQPSLSEQTPPQLTITRKIELPPITGTKKTTSRVPIRYGIREFAQGDLGGRKTGYFRLT